MGIERNPNVNIVNAVGEIFISGAEITKLLLRKDLLFEDVLSFYVRFLIYDPIFDTFFL